MIVGGGIIGASTTFFLAERAVPTLLCEKGTVAGEQSSRNWGRCRTMGRDPRELPLAIESSEALAADQRAHRCRDGLSPNRDRLDLPMRPLSRNAKPGCPTRDSMVWTSRLVRGAEVNAGPEVWPRNGWELYTPRATGRGARASRLRRWLMRHWLGASIMTNCAVRGIERSGGPELAVITERVSCVLKQ